MHPGICVLMIHAVRYYCTSPLTNLLSTSRSKHAVWAASLLYQCFDLPSLDLVHSHVAFDEPCQALHSACAAQFCKDELRLTKTWHLSVKSLLPALKVEGLRWQARPDHLKFTHTGSALCHIGTCPEPCISICSQSRSDM